MRVEFEDGRQLTGKEGDKVYFKRNGKTFVRNAPGKRKYETSSKQKITVEKFKASTMLYSVVIRDSEFLKKVWRIAAKDKPFTGYNYFIKKNCGAFDEEGVITDYSLINYSDGTLKLPPLIKAKAINKDDFEIRWENLDDDYTGKESDKLYVIMMYKDYTFTYLFFEHLNVKREDGSCILHFPKSKNKMPNIFCFFGSSDGSAFSPSKHIELDWDNF